MADLAERVMSGVGLRSPGREVRSINAPGNRPADQSQARSTG